MKLKLNEIKITEKLNFIILTFRIKNNFDLNTNTICSESINF